MRSKAYARLRSRTTRALHIVATKTMLCILRRSKCILRSQSADSQQAKPAVNVFI